MKKQILAVLLAAVMVFGLAACSKGADGTESDQKENKDENTKTSESEGDVVKLAVLLKAETDDWPLKSTSRRRRFPESALL